MKKPMMILAVGGAAITLVVLLAIATTQQQTPSRAFADDPTHVTALGVQPTSFPPGSGIPANAVVASLNAGADLLIETWSIDLFQTPPGMMEGHWGNAMAKRSDGETLGVTLSAELTAFPTGTMLRAVYECLDGTGLVLWTYQRTLLVP